MNMVSPVHASYSPNGGVIIVGGAAGSKIVYDIFTLQGKSILGFMNNYVKPEEWHGFTPKLLGSIDEPANRDLLCRPNTGYFVATGDNSERSRVTRGLFDLTGKLPDNAVHPTATVSSLAQVGTGNLINAGAIINAFATIGNGTIVNTGAIIEHDNQVGHYAQISPRVVLGGYVIVEALSFLGLGASVIPHITIGEGSIVGAGAVVIQDVEPYTLVAGVPATFKRRITE